MTKMRTIKVLVLTLVVSLWTITYSYGQACYGAGGCQDFANFGYNSTTAATLEYDNYVSGFHSTAVRDLDGSLKIWGEKTKADGVSSWLVPTTINAGNYPGLTGTPLKVAIGSNGINTVQFALLTSDNKIWAWGLPGVLFDLTVVPAGNTAFHQLSLGLPAGVTAADVKMFFGTTNTLVITTCDGSVYVLTNNSSVRGAGGAGSPDTWSRVIKTDGSFLNGIVATRGTATSLIALDASGGLWSWGPESWDGIGSRASHSRATALAAPAGASGSIKMIGANHTAYGTQSTSYYLLYTSGSVYALGDNQYGQLGDWTTTNSNTWVQPRYTSAGGPVINDVKWISPNEHDRGIAGINVLTNDKMIYNWGAEGGNMLGRGGNAGQPLATNPGVPTNFQAGYSNTNIISVESGGHTTMILRECTSTFGYVGHRINGSMGDNSSADLFDPTYHFNTNAVQVCGSQTVNATLDASYNGPYCIGNNVQLIGNPSGGTYAIDMAGSTATATLSGTTLTFTGAGTLRVNYTVSAGSCGSVTIVKVFNVEDCGAKVTIPGTIWNDADGDAVIDGGEAGIANGLWANLVGPDGNVIASVRVNTDGTYSFQIATSYLANSGNYSVVLTNSAKQVGDPLATADIPTGGYGYTGVNRGSTGVDKTNRTGKLTIGNLSGVAGGTATAPVNFGISNDPLALPVQFADVSAIIKGGVLFVNWTTVSEKNNKRFEIEASADGIHFTTIGSMDSKAPNGNSDSALSYEFSTNMSGLALATSGIALVLLALGSLAIGLPRKRKLAFASLLLTGIFAGVMGCQKNGSEPVPDGKSAYIRVAQIDADGSKSYSKIVKVVNN
ncbi:hypothetical protein LL912_24700 [Niabella sp. CC-SYL272]|uniref:hypothetical protein n=1 Tax=Niabella agricola TaxID=2891571 RepID=UPI001F3B2066|nr:hypothetical protein [Niabella agricola]MCF3112011.1 hypothetical protein [Niabella agricola]